MLLVATAAFGVDKQKITGNRLPRLPVSSASLAFPAVELGAHSRDV